MAQPQVRPGTLTIHVQPGESRDESLTFLAPSGGRVTASITGGDALVVLKQLTAIQYVWRDATDEEEAMLPPHPLRPGGGAKHARILEPQEVGRSDGAVPLNVPVGATCDIVLRFSAPADRSSDIAAATLTVDSTTWASVQVPITIVIGPADTVVAVDPAAVRLAAEPGQTPTPFQDIVISKAPVAAKVVVRTIVPDPIIRFRNAIVFKRETRPPTDAELSGLPPPLQERMRKEGVTQYREIGRTDGRTPLVVPQNALFKAFVDFFAPAQHPPDLASNRLIIDATTWQHIEVPLDLIIGKIAASIEPESFSARQGESGDAIVTITSVAGPDTEVHLALDPSKFGSIVPGVLTLARGAAAQASIKVAVAPETPLGTYPVGLDLRAFDQLQLRSLPFSLTVLPARITVTPLQTALSVMQGDRATCDVRVVSNGGYKRLTFEAGALPVGVVMNAPPAWEQYGTRAIRSTSRTIGNIRRVSQLTERPFSAPPPHDSAERPPSEARLSPNRQEDQRETTVGNRNDAPRRHTPPRGTRRPHQAASNSGASWD